MGKQLFTLEQLNSAIDMALKYSDGKVENFKGQIHSLEIMRSTCDAKLSKLYCRLEEIEETRNTLYKRYMEEE